MIWSHLLSASHHLCTLCLVSGEKFPLGKEALNRYFTPDMIKVPDGKRLNILQMEHTSFG